MNTRGNIFWRNPIAHGLFILVFTCVCFTSLCQMSVHEKLRMLKPLVSKVKANPNDEAACQELLNVANIPMIYDSNNSSDMAAFKESLELLSSIPEPCASSGNSNQKSPSISSPANNNMSEETINQIVSGAQLGYQKYADEIAEKQSQIGPAEQERAQAAEALQNTIDSSLDNLLSDLISEEPVQEAQQQTPTQTQEQKEEEALANYQMPPHGGYFDIFFEDTLLRVEANLRLIKSKKCYSYDNLRGIGPYGNYRYEIEIRIIRKKKIAITVSHEFKCAMDFQQDVFDPFKCLKDEQGYWDRFWVVDQNLPWPAENNDISIITGQFWTTVPNPPVKWAIKYN